MGLYIEIPDENLMSAASNLLEWSAVSQIDKRRAVQHSNSDFMYWVWLELFDYSLKCLHTLLLYPHSRSWYRLTTDAFVLRAYLTYLLHLRSVTIHIQVHFCVLEMLDDGNIWTKSPLCIRILSSLELYVHWKLPPNKPALPHCDVMVHVVVYRLKQ